MGGSLPVVAHPSEASFLVLHALRLKGFAESDVVATTTRLDDDEVGKRLDELAGDGLVVRRDGRVSGWSLTPDGRARHAALSADELAASGARDVVDGCYRRFLDVNADMLAVCTAWQLRDVDGTQSINDHSDADYDAGVVQRLLGIHDRVRPVCADLRDAL